MSVPVLNNSIQRLSIEMSIFSFLVKVFPGTFFHLKYSFYAHSFHQVHYIFSSFNVKVLIVLPRPAKPDSEIVFPRAWREWSSANCATHGDQIYIRETIGKGSARNKNTAGFCRSRTWGKDGIPELGGVILPVLIVRLETVSKSYRSISFA